MNTPFENWCRTISPVLFCCASVDAWAGSAIVIRCRFKVRALEQWNVRREYLRRLKNEFDSQGIEIPFPHITVYAGQDKNAVPLPPKLVGGGSAVQSS
ncbi:MAG: hypothetical protein ACREUQ_13410 [Burkholderiales bacterium]